MEHTTLLTSNMIYTSPWLRLRENKFLRKGVAVTYVLVDRPDTIIIIPMLPMNRTILLKQYRYPTNCIAWEFPMGGVENGETLQEAASRELLEEIGLEKNDFTKIGEFFPSPGLSSQRATVFTVEIKEEDIRQMITSEYADEILEVKLCTIQEVCHMAKNGGITDGYTLVGLSYLLLGRSEDHD